MAESERLARIEEMLGGLLKKMDEHVVDGAKWREEQRNLLFGKDGGPGLVVRLDRLEQDSARARWVTRAVIGAVISLVVAALAGAHL